jgi:hypothetical protein
VPSTISSTQKSRFIIRANDGRERFAQEALRWLSSLSFIHEFTLFSDLFLQTLHARGDNEISDTLRTEYFQGLKRGWARCLMPFGSAGTNNSLEAFNGSRGVRIFDSANLNFERVEKFNSNSNWLIGIRFARIVVIQNSFMNNSMARSNIRK